MSGRSSRDAGGSDQSDENIVMSNDVVCTMATRIRCKDPCHR